MSTEQLKEALAKAQAENERLRELTTVGVKVRLGEKGGIMVTGLGRFPATYYKEQWRKIFSVQAKVEALYPLAKDHDVTTAKAIG